MGVHVQRLHLAAPAELLRPLPLLWAIVVSALALRTGATVGRLRLTHIQCVATASASETVRLPCLVFVFVEELGVGWV